MKTDAQQKDHARVTISFIKNVFRVPSEQDRTDLGNSMFC